MDFGVWYDFRNPPQWKRRWDELYEETLEQIRYVDSLGFHSVWLSEHHVTREGYLPSMFPMLAALASETSNVRLGTAVLLGPMHHPIRVAEDAAVVDILSAGRIELGIGPGYRPKEFDTLGVPKRQRGKRTDEMLEILRIAWEGRPFSFEGPHFKFDDITVQPTPLQDPLPIWIGGSSLHSAERAARYGCHYMPDGGAPVEVYHRYRELSEQLGTGPGRIATNRSVYVCEDPEQGWNDIKEHVLYVFNMYREWFAEAGDFPELGEPLTDPDPLREHFLLGTPDMVGDGIEQLQAEFGVDLLVFWARPPGLAIEKSTRSLELFAQEVLPRFS